MAQTVNPASTRGSLRCQSGLCGNQALLAKPLGCRVERRIYHQHTAGEQVRSRCLRSNQGEVRKMRTGISILTSALLISLSVASPTLAQEAPAPPLVKQL